MINIQNNDQRCFGYAILAYLHPIKHNAHLPIFYNKFFNEHHLDTIHYPVQIEQIPEIEEMLQIAINVFSFLMMKAKPGIQNI